MARLDQAPRSARDLAKALTLPTRAVVRRLSSLVAAGHVRVVATATMPPARRPVAIYGLAADRPADSLVQALCRSWAAGGKVAHVCGAVD